MMRYGIWVTFLLAVQLSSVLGRNEFYEYYYNKYHHKSHSTTTALSSSTAEISTEQKISSSLSVDDDSSESVEHSSTVDFELSKHKNKTSHSYGERHKYHHKFFSRSLLVVGSIIAFLCIIGLTVCCCPKYCRGREQGGSNRRSEIVTTEEHVQQPVLMPYPQQQVVIPQYIPQYPGDSIQQYPSEFQPRVMQSQQQYYASQRQFYGLPEPPPPYDFPAK